MPPSRHVTSRHVTAAAGSSKRAGARGGGERLSLVLTLMLRSSDCVQPLLRMLHVRYTRASILGIPSRGEKGSQLQLQQREEKQNTHTRKQEETQEETRKKLIWQFAEM